MPGVLGVYTGADLGPPATARCRCVRAVQEPRRLADEEADAAARWRRDKVRFVGDPVAFVVAETLAQAKDAAEAVELEIDALPAVTDAASTPRRPARRSSMTTRPATSRSTTITATPTKVAAAFARGRARHAG